MLQQLSESRHFLRPTLKKWGRSPLRAPNFDPLGIPWRYPIGCGLQSTHGLGNCSSDKPKPKQLKTCDPEISHQLSWRICLTIWNGQRPVSGWFMMMLLNIVLNKHCDFSLCEINRGLLWVIYLLNVGNDSLAALGYAQPSHGKCQGDTTHGSTKILDDPVWLAWKHHHKSCRNL